MKSRAVTVVPKTEKKNEFLPFALPDIGDEELDEIRDALESGWVTTGPKTKQFEFEFAAAVGARHAVAVNSGTAALHLALESVGVKQGSEVVIPAYTFAATAEVVRYFDARPVLVDIDEQTFNINPALIERAITEKTSTILPVHIAGLPADLDAIKEVARKYNLPVVEDAAHSFPTKYKGRMVGSIGDVTAFSFYATKTLTTGEGGMICTENEEWADRCRIMSLHGISKDAWKRYTAEGSWYYEIVAPGYKYNMTDIAAAMGLAQLRKTAQMHQRRAEIAMIYNEAFSGVPEVQLPKDDPSCQHAWHLYMVRLHLNRLTIDRARFIAELKERNIGASVHFIPLHIHPYYREAYGYKPQDFPVSFNEYMREVSLPIYSKMSENDMSRVVEVVKDVIGRYRR